MVGSWWVGLVNDTPIFLVLNLHQYHFTAHAPKGLLMPFAFCIQDRLLTPQNVDCFTDLPRKAVPEHTSCLGCKIRRSVLMFLFLVLLDKGISPPFPTSIFVHMFFGPGVQVPATLPYVDTFVLIRTHLTLKLVLYVSLQAISPLSPPF